MSTLNTSGNFGQSARVVGVLTADVTLYRKIFIALRHRATVLPAKSASELEKYDLLIADVRDGDSFDLREVSERVLRVLRRDEKNSDEGVLPYPFSYGELYDLLAELEPTAKRLIIESDGRHVCLDGERIRLTESEHRLLSAMAEGNGDFVARERLVAAAFGDCQDGGILNVYVHYLREKLEHKGEKIILSSRKSGYKIDAKYLGGEK